MGIFLSKYDYLSWHFYLDGNHCFSCGPGVTFLCFCIYIYIYINFVLHFYEATISPVFLYFTLDIIRLMHEILDTSK